MSLNHGITESLHGARSETETAPTPVSPPWESRPRLSGQTIWPGEIPLASLVFGLPCCVKAFRDNVETHSAAAAGRLERRSERQFGV